MQKRMLPLSVIKYLGVLAIAYNLFIGWGSLIHVPAFVQRAPENSDKVIHTTAYFLLCLLWFLFLYLNGKKKWSLKKALIISLVWSVFFGMIIEFLQFDFTTYRSGDYKDMIANATGALLSVLFVYSFRRKLSLIKSEL